VRLRGEPDPVRLVGSFGLSPRSAVAEDLHFARAAERLHLSTTTVSASVRRLEHELGGALFVRTTRTVRLTPLGDAFFGDAREAFDAVANAYRRARQLAASDAPSVLVGYCYDSERHSVFELLPEFRELHPGAVIDFRRFSTGTLMGLLRRREIDICICYGPELDPAFEAVVLGFAGAVALVPANHRLARRRTIALAEVAREPLVFFDREGNPTVYDRMTSALDATGERWEIATIGPDIENLAARTLAGMGIAIGLDVAVGSIPVSGVVAVEISGVAPVERVLVWRPDNDRQPVRDLVDLISHEEAPEGDEGMISPGAR
jgi:DNA-binding transcriptional LysR family regulator